MKHWGSCALVLWVIAAILAAIVVWGCGSSKYYTIPGPLPDTSDCKQVERSFSGKMLWTPFPFPFEGTRTMKLWAAVPPGWDEFDGQVYLMSGRWNVTWVKELRMSIEPYQNIATWNGDVWTVDSRVDVKPLLKREDEWLSIEPKVYARGTKPKGNPGASVVVTLAVCGKGREGVR